MVRTSAVWSAGLQRRVVFSGMPRHRRLSLPGVPLHVIHRGTDRCAIFRDGLDFRVYWNVIKDASRRAQCAIHAYVMMTNHVHLLVAPVRAGGVASMIQIVGRQYVQYFNRRHGRTGTLWEGRYRSAIIDSDQYLFACMRYIELNPVRAAMTHHPRDYAWSSYLANAELEPDPLVTPHALYRGLAGDAIGRAASYRAMVAYGEPYADSDAQLREATKGGRILGSPAFRRRVVDDLGLPSEPKRHGGRRR